MSKNNTKIIPEKKLASTVTLQHALELLKCKKEYVSKEKYEASCDFIAVLFNLSYNEVDQAVNGNHIG